MEEDIEVGIEDSNLLNHYIDDKYEIKNIVTKEQFASIEYKVEAE